MSAAFAGSLYAADEVPIPSVVVGKTAGEFQVNNAGAAVYDIPLAAAPGRHGMSPKLSLQYSSQNGHNGLLGLGWSLQGMSTITRCGKSKKHNGGFTQGETYNREKSGYCLDGQLLIPISGVNGAEQTEYRTERDPFVRIVSHGTFNNSPKRFTVTTKDGDVFHYGVDEFGVGSGHLRRNQYRFHAETWNSNSSVDEVKVWALVKSTDRNDNYMEFSYEKNHNRGYILPTKILYGGHQNNGLHTHKVEFEYQNRLDIYPKMKLYGRTSLAKALSEVKFFSNDSMLRRYDIGYKHNSIKQRSRVAFVQECSATECFKATTFNWSAPKKTDEFFGSNQIQGTTASAICAGNIDEKKDLCTTSPDFDRDGYPDLVYEHPTLGLQVYFGSSEGYVGHIDTGICRINDTICKKTSERRKNLNFADINGDGFLDIILHEEVFILVFEGSREGFSLLSHYYCPIICKPENTHYVDVDLDGFDDAVVLFEVDESVYYHFQRGSVDGLVPSITNGVLCSQNCKGFDLRQAQFGERNGDGYPDLFLPRKYVDVKGKRKMQVLHAGGGSDGFQNVQITSTKQFCGGPPVQCDNLFAMQVADIDGDGLSDIAIALGNEFTGSLYTYHNIYKGGNSAYFSSHKQAAIFRGIQMSYRLSDINGDGTLDLIYRKLNETLQFAIMAGFDNNHTFRPSKIIQTEFCDGVPSCDFFGIVNVDGDSMPDFAVLNTNGDGMRVLTDVAAFSHDINSQAIISNVCKEGSSGHGGCDNQNNHLSVNFLDINGDGADDMLYRSDSGVRSIKVNTSPGERINAITDGYGAITEIDYATLVDKSVYTKDAGIHYSEVSNAQTTPNWRQITPPIHVVKEYLIKQNASADCELIQQQARSSNILLLTSTRSCWKVEHHYQELTAERNYGLLGFKRIIAIDHQQKVRRTTTLYLDPELAGKPARVTISDIQNPDVLLSDEAYTYCGGQRCPQVGGIYQPRITEHVSAVYNATEGNDFIGTTASVKHYTDTQRYRYEDYLNTNGLPTGIQAIHQSNNENRTYLSCSAYNTGASAFWKRTFITETRVTTASICPTEGSSFSSDQDISLSQYTYDNKMNKETDSSWVDKGLFNVNDHDTALPGQFATTSYQYDAYGNVIQERDASNLTVNTVYDSLTHTYPAQVTQQGTQLPRITEYDVFFGVLTLEKDANGIQHIHQYDGFGRHLKTQATSPTGAMVDMVKTHYDQNEDHPYIVRTETRKDWDDGSSFLFRQTFYDALGREQKVLSSGSGNGLSKSVGRLLYDGKSQVVEQQIPAFINDVGQQQYDDSQNAAISNGASIYNTYDRQGRLVERMRPMGTLMRHQYLLEDQLKIITHLNDPSSSNVADTVEWQELRNSLGQVVTRIGPDGAQTLYEYDAIGRLTSMIDPLGLRRTITYNSVGDVISNTEKATGTTRYSYDLVGRIKAVVKESKSKKLTTYDHLGRISEVQDFRPQKSDAELVASYTYGQQANLYNNGRLIKIDTTHYDGRLGPDEQEDKGVDREFVYDAAGQMVALTIKQNLNNDSDNIDPGEVMTSGYEYNARGAVTKYIYPDGSMAIMSYSDDDARLVEIGYRESGSSQTESIVRYDHYHASGQPVQTTYGNGVRTSMSFDLQNRPLTHLVTNNSTTLFDRFYTWNAANKVTNIQDGMDSALDEAFNYSNIGRLVQATGAYGNINYNYDAAGNLTQKDGLSYTLDGHQISVLIENGKEQALQHDVDGNLTHWESKNGLRRYFYNADGRLVLMKQGRRQLGRFVYDNATGNRTAKIDYKDNRNNKKLRTSYYPGNGIDIVVNHKTGDRSYTKNIGAVAAITEQMPANGFTNNIVQRIEDNHDALMASVASGVGFSTWGRAGSDRGGDVSANIQQWLAAIGALLLIAFITCLHASHRSFIGRMRQRLLARLIANGLLSRQSARQLIHPTSSAAGVGRRLLVALLCVSHFSVYVLSPPAFADLTPGTNGAGIPVIGQVQYFHQDFLNSVSVVTNQNGDVVNQTRYKPFGEIDQARSQGTDSSRPKFTGKELDSDTGLYYFGARYYDPVLGRFLTPDAAKQFHSPYLYGAGDPMTHVDPDGNFALVTIAITAAISLGIGYVSASISAGTLNPAKWTSEDWAEFGISALFGFATIATAGATSSLYATVAIGSVFSAVESVAVSAVRREDTLSATYGAITGALFSYFGDLAGAVLGRVSNSVTQSVAHKVNLLQQIKRQKAARVRQKLMIKKDVGFNISPFQTDSFPTIGRNGTFITDKKGITNVIGNFSGQKTLKLSKNKVVKLEKAFGLEPGSLKDGFKVRQIDGIGDLNPRLPKTGNRFFQGEGNHLPGGAPETVIDSVPTVDTDKVRTILEVQVEWIGV